MHLCAPLVALGALASVLVFVTNEYLVPAATRQSQYVLEPLHQEPAGAQHLPPEPHLVLRGAQHDLQRQLLDPVERSLEGVTLYRFDANGTRLVQRIDARNARYRRGRWTSSTSRSGPSCRTERSRRARSPGTACGCRKNPGTSRNTRAPRADELSRPRRVRAQAAAQRLQSHVLPGRSPGQAVAAAGEPGRHAARDPIAFRSRLGGGIVGSLGASLTLGFAYWVVISVGSPSPRGKTRAPPRRLAAERIFRGPGPAISGCNSSGRLPGVRAALPAVLRSLRPSLDTRCCVVHSYQHAE